MNARTLGIPILLLTAAIAAGCIGQSTPTASDNTQPTQTSASGAAGNASGNAQGAASGATAVAGNGTAASAAATAPVVKKFDGMAQGLGSPSTLGCCLSTSTDGKDFFQFDVKEGATAVVVEVVWAGSDKLDTFLGVAKPSCTDPAPVDPFRFFAQCDEPKPATTGTSPERIVVLDAKYLTHTGQWGAFVGAEQTPPPGTAFKAAASVFYGGVPADGYSALKPAA